MKTAMQELKVDILIEKQLGFITENASKRIIDYIDNLYLEKEKEQIMNAYVKGFDISAEGWNGEYGIKDFNNIKEEIKAEELYNQTYNHLHISTDGKVGLSNADETTNNKISINNNE